MKILVTGGAGFIGSAAIKYILANSSDVVVNVDSLTYAGNLDSLTSVENQKSYQFEHIDIRDKQKLHQAFKKHQPHAVMHLAAESHVDRSIDDPSIFIQTNIVGTYNLLEVSREYWSSLSHPKKSSFRFHHVSTDEVFGDLINPEDLFTESTPLCP